MPMTKRRVFVSVGPRGARVRDYTTFPADALPSDIRAWREQRRTELRKDQPDPPAGFAADAAAYLEAVAALPSIKDRRRDIALWVAEFDETDRAKITAAQIRTARDRWLTVGPRHVQHWKTDTETGKKVRRDAIVVGPLSASTVNHRLRALENLYTVLDGKHAKNPVRDDVPEVEEEEGPIRAIPLPVVRAILATMPDTATKARLRVMAATGLPHSTMGRIAAADVDLKGKTVWVPGRRKGKGTKGRLMPLTAEAVTAFRLLGRHNAWGAFSRGSLRKAWVRACHAAALTVALRPYDLRHSMATLTLRATGDVRATQMLMGHSSPKVTERYARAAVDPALQAAALKVEQAQRQPRKKRR